MLLAASYNLLIQNIYVFVSKDLPDLAAPKNMMWPPQNLALVKL